MGVLIKEQRRLADLGGFEQGTVDQTLPAGSSYSQCKNNHENFLITRVRTINLIKAKNLVINIKSGFLYFLILFDGNKQFQHIASNDWLTESQIEIGNSETEYFAIAIRKSDNSTISTSEVSQALNEVFVITEYPDVKVATSEEEAYTEGRNLLLYSKATPENAKYWTARAFVTIEYGNPPDFFPYYKVRVSSDATMSDSAGIAGSHIGIHSVARLEKGKKYLWHFMCHSDVDYPFGASRVGHIQTRPILESSNPCHVEINMKYSPKTIPANTWTHCMVEFEVTEDAWFVPYLWYLSNNGTLQGKVIRFGQFMLEEGTTAHPYRPAPEDLVGGGY